MFLFFNIMLFECFLKSMSVWEQVEVHSLLLAEVMGGASKNAIKSVTKQLNKLWKDVRLSAAELHIGHVSF